MTQKTKKRVLFVDDEPNFLDAVRRMLRNQAEEWDMSFVSNPYAAFEQICNNGFDTIVLDVMMPCMNGFDLLEKIKNTEWTKDIPVLVLTGSSGDHYKQRALDLGAADLLNKPVCTEDLIARIGNMLRLKSYQDRIVAQNALLDRQVRERTLQLEESRIDLIWSLGRAAEYRDYNTGNHIVRVGCYSRIIAETLGMNRDFVEMIFLASPLHDIGKLGITDDVLLKRGKLTHGEYEYMKRHCVIGAEILQKDYKTMVPFFEWKGIQTHLLHKKNNPLLVMASVIALTHHERWDGKGYPGGLAGDKIPMESRIAALADVFDALRSVRPYKPAYPESETMDIIRGEVGGHFDPAVYAAFEKSFDKINVIRMQYADVIAELSAPEADGDSSPDGYLENNVCIEGRTGLGFA